MSKKQRKTDALDFYPHVKVKVRDPKGLRELIPGRTYSVEDLYIIYGKQNVTTWEDDVARVIPPSGRAFFLEMIL